MEFKSAKLRGRIVEKYGSLTEFAIAMGGSSQAIGQKLSGKVGISREEIIKWTELLELDINDISTYFFTPIDCSEDLVKEE